MVYGPTDHALPADFLWELCILIDTINNPTNVEGDFNLIRTADDKSSHNICWSRVHMFNDAYAYMELREIQRVGARDTWTNHQLKLICSVLDRVLVSADWELAYPISSLKAESRIGSDHTHLFFTLGEELLKRNPTFFL